MEPFVILEGIAAPLELANVDTGQIMPARFLRRPRNAGYQDFLFRDLRFSEDGKELPDFVLNQAAYHKARILVAGRTFGAGSSREQAAWGLTDFGIRCVIAVDFGDIFYANAFKSGLLPIRVDVDTCAKLRSQLNTQPGTSLRIDLPAQTISAADGTTLAFEIDPFRKRCLLEGLDEIGITLQYEEVISAFEQGYRHDMRWLFGIHP